LYASFRRRGARPNYAGSREEVSHPKGIQMENNN
jgi:hypothetical protein